MTTLALVLGAIALVGSVVAFVAVRALFHLLTDVRDHMKVLHVSVYGLETKLSPVVDGAREASEAALVRVGDLVTAMNALNANAEVETAREADVREALGGRVRSARALFALAEAESAAALNRKVANG